LGHIANGISKLACLLTINFNFESCFKVTDAGLRHISQSIKGLANLKDIIFIFKGCKLTYKGLKDFGKALGGLRHVEKLCLSFAK